MTRGKNVSSYSAVAVRSKKTELRHPGEGYWTPPIATQKLLRSEQFIHPIWEPACGKGHISEVLKASGHQVISSDKYDYGYGKTGLDFLECDPPKKFQSLITNPPFEQHLAFLKRAAEVTPRKFSFLMRLQYLEGVTRSNFYKQFHLNVLIVGRLPFEVDGTIKKMIPYAWYTFDLTQKEKRIAFFYDYSR